MPVRLIAAVCCLAVAGLFVAPLGDYRACDRARADLFAITLGDRPPAGQPAALRTIGDRCRGSEGLATASGALRAQGRPRQALALAARAARREPESAQAWAAIAAAARSINPGLSRRAATRARALGAAVP